jgi:hypothetical protein
VAVMSGRRALPTMSTVEIQLRQQDARLVFLAVAYHLGRPGSELDPITKQPVELGLAEVAAALQPQLGADSASIVVSGGQAKRLLSGMLGTISELKAYTMLDLRAGPDGDRRSTVPGFDRTLTHLFPQVEEDPEEALGVAEEMLVLKRRLDDEVGDLVAEAEAGLDAPPAKPEGKGWWPFRKKS